MTDQPPVPAFRAELIGLMKAVSAVMDTFKHTDKGLALSQAFCEAERALAEPPASPTALPTKQCITPCEGCSVLQHCNHHGRCLAECQAIDLVSPALDALAREGQAKDRHFAIASANLADTYQQLESEWQAKLTAAEADLAALRLRLTEAEQRIDKALASIDYICGPSSPWQHGAKTVAADIAKVLQALASRPPAHEQTFTLRTEGQIEIQEGMEGHVGVVRDVAHDRQEPPA